jgi:hypothetical protein
MVDRVLDRVTIPLLMMELCILLIFIMGNLRENIAMTWKAIICILLLVTPIVSFSDNWKSLNNEMELRAQADIRWKALAEYCKENNDSYFTIDVYSLTSYNGANYSEKIFKDVDNSYRNFDICGGWAAKSPLMREKLAVSGIKYIQSALYLQKAYFIAACDRDVTWLGRYYYSRGYDAAIICVDTIYTDDNEAAFSVYRIEERH